MQKKPGTRKRNIPTHYSIEILDWNLSYSFQLTGKMKDMAWPFWEHKSLKLKGKFFEPNELINREIEAYILGDRRYVHVLEHPEEPVQEPRAIGGLTVRGKQSELLCSLPYDTLQMLSVLLTAGKIKVLEISGESLYRGSADIRSIRFEKEYVPEPE